MNRSTSRIIRAIIYMIPTAVFIIASSFKIIYYHMGDDELMNTIAIGKYTGKPDEHLIYINTIFGYITKTLFKITKSINWYAIIYMLIILVCLYVLLNVLEKYTKWYLSILIILFIEAYSIYWFTFTVISYMCIVVGVIKLVDNFSLYKPLKIRKEKLQIVSIIINLIIIFVLFLTSYIIRTDAFKTGFILSFPLILINIKQFVRRKREALVLILAIVLGIVGLQVINNFSYNSKLWTNYIESNRARSSCFDKTILNYSEDKEFYDKLHFTSNDIEGIRDSFFVDKKVFAPQKLYKISNHTPVTVRYNFNPLTYLNEIEKQSLSSTLYIATILLIIELVMIGICCIWLGKKKRAYYALQVIFNIGFVCVLCFVRRPVARVLLTSLIMGIALLFYSFVKFENINRIKIRRILSSVVSLILLVHIVLYGWKTITNANYFKGYEYKQAMVREYTDKHKDELFLAHRKWEWLFYKPVLSINGSDVCPNIMQTGDQDTYNNLYYEQLDSLKIDNKNRLLSSLLNNSKTYLLVDKNTDGKILNLVKTYFKEHHNKTIIFKKVKSFKKPSICIYKIRSSN